MKVFAEKERLHMLPHRIGTDPFCRSLKPLVERELSKGRSTREEDLRRILAVRRAR